ncbi:hypothetical protein FOWG_10349 [Fusarium oxysporum f. sp. lycopersici MN25]|nr:hypothetical protein FOWG_10349 [Fusarium oxysporum f. sp. lycopersici MN25]
MVRRRRKNILIIKQTSNTFKTTTLHHRLYNQAKHLITQYSLFSITLIMGLIGLAICAIMSATDSKQPRSTGCCGSRKQQAYLVQQPQLIGPNPDYMAINSGRSSCHQRKTERRYQKKMQRAERMQLRAEQRAERDYQRAERRQAGVAMVKSGAQKVGMIGRSSSQNVHETREFHEEPNNGVFELDAMNQQHVERDAPPAYDDVVRK